MQPKKHSRILIAFVKLTGIIPALLFFKPKVYCAEGAKKRLPKPCILMSNHTSLMDFVLYLIIFPWRCIHFLMAEVLFNKGKAFSWFLFKLGGIFVDRDAFDFSFVGETLDALDAGQTVGIFPQGRLPVNGKPFPFKPSVVYIALRTDSPIIPIYTDGRYHPLKRTGVMIGKPIYLREMCSTENPDEAKLEELRSYLEESVDKLRIELEKRKAK
jgi:1-acyl-sn-glycerol-3-phosphate acyltransferase